jgi:hypothetical protein
MNKQLAVLTLMSEYTKKRISLKNDFGGYANMSAFIMDNSWRVLCLWL